MRYMLALILSFLSFGLLSSGDAVADRATVLIVLEPKKPNGKNWDIFKGADPALCVDRGCYISRGYDRSARFFSGRSVLVPGIRASYCRNSLKCVYRNIQLKRGYSVVQPVDLDSVDHDFMTKRSTYVDESCIFSRGRINCNNGVYTAEYSLWIIPEAVADAGGAKALDYATFKSMQEAKTAYIEDYLRAGKKALPDMVSRFYQLILERDIPKFCSQDSEVIAEAFHIAGLAKSRNRKFGPFFAHYIGGNTLATTLNLVRLDPQVFWNFRDAMDQFEDFTSAEIVQRLEGVETVRLLSNKKGKKSLLIGWPVKSRARGVIEDCINRSS